MDNREEEEIQNALNETVEDMQFEEIPETDTSPINEPVKTGEVSTGMINLSEVNEQEEEVIEQEVNKDLISEQLSQLQENDNSGSAEAFEQQKPLDAPEQEVDLEEEELTEQIENQGTMHIPDSHATLAANSLLGIANNALEIGGGFFVKIKKTKELLEFDEAIRVVDRQNKKNIQRIKLDEEDQALLRPILIQVLKNRAEELTPEQQLIAASISIIMKKVQMMAEIKAENKMMVSNIRDAIRAEIRAAKEEAEEENVEEEIEEVEVEDFDKKAA